MTRIMDEHGGANERLLWVEGDISELALANLRSRGWSETSDAFRKLAKATKN